ncbi:MAG: hypothetical protein OEQ74_02050, partial [Gammaproteobacteria bacterium]|nr:hypothetical protein [Gammaproteobacteria bacterium]
SLVLAWVLEWTPEGVKLEVDVDRSESVAPYPGRKMTYGIIGLLTVALTISITLNVTGLRDAEQTASISQRNSSIAVLPFESRSTDPENALFADGIHDDLLTGLANIQALKVISRTSVLKYRNPTRNLPEIASELGVNTVLEGSVQRAGDNVRVNVQLIDAQTDEHIWAKIYDRELTAKNIFRIQSEISAEITNALRTQLTPEEQGRMAAIPTENLEAYSLCMAGRGNVYKRRLETLQEARQQYQDAIELDPEYSFAYSGLADSILLLMINHKAIPQPEAHRLARQALEKALALDDKNADAYASLGLLKMNMGQREKDGAEFAEAEAAFRKAIELSPNHAQAYTWFASLKSVQLDLDGAAALHKKSLVLDPLARIPRSNLAGLYAQMGRNDEALTEWLEGVRINPEWPTAYDNVAIHLAGLGRLDEAYAWSIKARELNTDPLAAQSLIGVLLQFGETEQASAVLSGLPEDHPLYPIVDGFQKMFVGDYREAIVSWEQAIAAGFKSSKEFLVDPMSDSALLIGDFAKSLDYALHLNPALADPDFEVDTENAHNALKYAYLLLREDPANARAQALLDETLSVVETMPRLGMAGHGSRDVQILALQGRPDEALARLRQAFDQGFRGSRIYDNWNLSEDPYLESIRDTDAFRSVQSDIRSAVAVMQRRVQTARSNGNIEPILSSTRREST